MHSEPCSEKIALLRSYFQRSGVLLCNENRELPSLATVGGDWNSIVALIEQGEVFYSKLYKGRVTYLSRAFYYQIRQYRQRCNKLTPKSMEILEFIEAAELAGTKAIKETLMLSAKAFASCMDELFKELFVTAVRRDKTMNVNWSSFLWGTFKLWERQHPFTEAGPDAGRLDMQLLPAMSDKQVQCILK